MKNLRILSLAFMMVAFLGVISCKSDDAEPTDQELTEEALSGTWTLNTSSSDFANLVETPDATVTVTATGITITGGLAAYVSNISYSVSETGSLTGADATIASSEIEISGDVTATINDSLDMITVSFATSPTARVAGTGTFKLVFDKAS